MHFKSALLIAAAVLFSFHFPAWGDGAIALVGTKAATEPATENVQETQQAATDPEPTTDIAIAPDPIPSETDLWKRIRTGYALQDLDSPLVARHESWYARHPDYVERMMERSKLYLYYIVEEVEKRGMPTEVALLPMIESAFIPTAQSRRKAAGIWQFIPGTGKKYGLEQDWWYDGRRDVIDATQAALDYLQTLYGEFGNWELALAAYNCGEKKIARLLAQNRAKGLPQDYQSLKKLPRETRNYIPKLIAIRNIVSNPAAYGLSLDEIPNTPYFTTVSAPSHIDVKLAAQLAEMPLEEFISLNPAYMRPVIKGETTTLLLPVNKADTFAENLENHDQPLVSWQIYRAGKSEWLDKIAQRFGISLVRLKQVNGILPRSKITIAGQTLLVPLNSGTALGAARKPSGSLHPLY
jgi:membrane-bound lytic murein transglycosylase D